MIWYNGVVELDMRTDMENKAMLKTLVNRFRSFFKTTNKEDYLNTLKWNFEQNYPSGKARIRYTDRR